MHTVLFSDPYYIIWQEKVKLYQSKFDEVGSTCCSASSFFLICKAPVYVHLKEYNSCMGTKEITMNVLVTCMKKVYYSSLHLVGKSQRVVTVGN